MPLCQQCQAIPFRKSLQQMNGDNSVRDAFFWYHEPWLDSTDDSLQGAYVVWHEDVRSLRQSAASCSFCHLIQNDLDKSYHYTTKVKKGEKRKVWLNLPKQGSGTSPFRRGNPQITMWIGDTRPEVHISGNWWFGTTPDSPTAPFFDEHVVLEDSLHPAVLNKMDTWLVDCSEKHTKCAYLTSRRTPLPTRLLDLTSLPSRKDMIHAQSRWGSLFNSGYCRLIETVQGSTGDYIALSYCWGKSLAYTTTTSNLTSHKQEGINFPELPKTLQDAVIMVRYLGFGYMWADCLCIIQDDKKDWEHEAANMANVYSNACLTIAATRANHCDEGFLQPRKIRVRQSVHIEDDEGPLDLQFNYDDCTISPGSMESVIPQPLRVQRDEPLLDRVWCFQERVLAVRTLHFATDQMYWECAECFEEELGIVRSDDTDFYTEYSLQAIADALRNTSNSFDNRLRDPWVRMVQEYTSRNMTYQSDKLPALSGVIGALQRLTGDTCYAGIWKSWFLKGLLWRVQIPETDIYVFVPKQPRRLDFWRAPSWSFAALEGVAVYSVVENALSFQCCAQLEECNVKPSGINLLGELESGYARIKGPITTLIAIEQEKVKHLKHLSNGRACTVQLSKNRHVYAGVYFDCETYESCNVLMITSEAGLVIRPIDVDNGTYIRVGAISVYVREGMVDDEGREVDLGEHYQSLEASDYPEPISITLV